MKKTVIRYLSKTYLKDAEKLGYTLDDLINMKTRRKIIEEIERGDANNVKRTLSKKYLEDAKKLGYTWKDLIRKTTRENVINKVIKSKIDRAINKAMEDTINMNKYETQFRKKENKVRKNMINERIMKEPKTDIKQLNKALKGYTKSFEISIINNKDPLEQLQNTRKAIEYHITRKLKSMKGLKFIETLMVAFKKFVNSEIVYQTAYFNSKPQTITNDEQINEALQLSKEQILNIIAQWISKGSG